MSREKFSKTNEPIESESEEEQEEDDDADDDDAKLTCDFANSVFGEFFLVVSVTESNKNIDVCCKLCVNSKKTYSTSKSSKSNLKTHMKVSTCCLCITLI